VELVSNGSVEPVPSHGTDKECVMAAYVILDVTVEDAAAYAEYVKAGTPSVPQYGGRYIVREETSRFSREVGSRSALL
jgi:hypothetical protein